jgi:riboflavin kinase/FMN adenylyltransferase
MRVIRTATDLAPGSRRVCLAIGVFDGVHLGHQQIIRQTIADAHQHGALSLVVTFDRHPSAIVAPDRVPPLVYPLPQKLRAIESLGADALLLIEFNRAFSEQTGEVFIRGLARDLGSRRREEADSAGAGSGQSASSPRRLQSICVGADFVFGHRRSGNVALLRQLGAELGFTVHGMAAVSLDNEVVSSTRIRAAIEAGNLDAASQMLGRAYSISGPVVHGDQLGHKLGFPTANLDVTALVLPPDGVYAARVFCSGTGVSPVQCDDRKHVSPDRQDACPTMHQAALNIGKRPTVKTGRHERRFEVHLLDFNGDLYGKELEVEFAAKLRDEMKFASLDALKAQIAADVAAATKCF